LLTRAGVVSIAREVVRVRGEQPDTEDIMKVIVTEHVTLDGVMQAPGRADEDARQGFEHGGWAHANMDEVMGKLMAEWMAKGGAMLFGRRTYQDFFGFWPKQKDNPFTPKLNRTTKYVVSRTLKEPLPWQSSILIDGDVVAEVSKLRQAPGDNLAVLGSGQLVQTLARHDLVDEYRLMIHPVILGKGARLFPDGAPFSSLELLACTPTTKGVVIATYRPRR
jgi:dihydrofolate reductase